MHLMKRSFNALGLSLVAALSLMTTATTAQASGKFEVLGSTTLSASLVAEVDKLFQFLFSIFEIDCTTIKTEEGTLLTSGGIGHVRYLLEGCALNVTSPTLKTINTCSVYPTAKDGEQEINAGKLIVEGLLSVFLHEEEGKPGKAYVLFEGPKGGYMEVFFGELCPFQDFLIAGSLVLEFTGAVKPLVQVAPKSLFPETLKFGMNNATYEGSLWLSLIGAHTGCTWGAV